MTSSATSDPEMLVLTVTSQDVNWIPFNPSQEYVTNRRCRLVMSPEMIVPGLPDNVNQINPRSFPNVDPTTIDPSEWQSMTFSAQDFAIRWHRRSRL